MKMVSASLVLYNNPRWMFEKAIQSFLAASKDGRICIVDNSPEPLFSDFFMDPRVTVISSGLNLGFGSAHNLAVKSVACKEGFHLIMNPDVFFSEDAVLELASFLESNPIVGAVMPSIYYPDGGSQHLCKRLPSPLVLLARRIFEDNWIGKFICKDYVMDKLPTDRVTVVPSLSACFLMVRVSSFNECKGFDERFFMYMEDVDLVRRIGDKALTVFYPMVKVYHHYAKGSYRSFRLLLLHIKSSVLYFNKWGWLFDSRRNERNCQVREINVNF